MRRLTRLAAAEKLINDCGYDRRNGELADAKAAIFRVEFRPTQSTAAERKVRDDATETPRPFEGGYWVREGRCDKGPYKLDRLRKEFQLELTGRLSACILRTKVSKEFLWAFWKAPRFRGS